MNAIRRGSIAMRAAPIGLAAILFMQGASAATLSDQLATFTGDLAMPSSPAAIHAGLTADDSAPARTRRQFEVGLAQLFGGSNKASGTFEFAPYLVFAGDRLDYKTYTSSLWLAPLTRTSIGFAAGDRESGDTKVAVKAYALTTIWYDRSDPTYFPKLETCITKALSVLSDETKARNEAARAQQRQAELIIKRIDGPTGELALARQQSAPDMQRIAALEVELTAAKDTFVRASAIVGKPITPGDPLLADGPSYTSESASKLLADCKAREYPEAKLWNRTRIASGLVAGHGRESSGEKRKLALGNAIWISAQYGFEGIAALESSAQLTLLARRKRGASDWDLTAAGDLARHDSSLLGLRFTWGSDKRNAFVEASRHSLGTAAGTQRIRQHAFGASVKLAENLWLNAVSGRRKQFLNEKLESVTSLNIQLGADTKPVVANPIP